MVANLTTKLGQLVDVLTPDTTNTRIGVANASPTRTLDVTGTGAISTSLALGGATIGTNALAVTGTTQLNNALGIGMTPTNILDITQNQNARSRISLLNNNASSGAFCDMVLSNGTSGLDLACLGTGFTTSGLLRQDGGFIGHGGAGGLTITTQAAQPIYFGINSAEGMKLDGNGKFIVNSSVGGQGGWFTVWDSNSSTLAYLRSSATPTHMMEMINTNSNSGAAITFQYFQTVYGAAGTIVCTTTNTAYNTSSDYRMKENVQPMTGGLSTIAALKPVIFDWIPSKTAGEGFIAHELQAVIPAAVSGEKDALYEDGSINAQGVDFGKIVPHLVAAVQELTTRLAALENK